MDDFPFGKEYFGRLCQTVSSQVGGGADQRLGYWGEVSQIFCLTGLDIHGKLQYFPLGGFLQWTLCFPTATDRN